MKRANISVATDYCHTSHNGEAVIETTWHRVLAWEGKLIKDFDQLKKGSQVHVIGRIRTQRYIATDGSQKTAIEIIASKVELM